MQQPLMNHSAHKPHREACGKNDRQREVSAEAEKGREIKGNTRNDPPQRSLCVKHHEIEIAFLLRIKPDEHNQPCKRHCGNETGKRGDPFSELNGEDDDGVTEEQLQHEIHDDPFPSRCILSWIHRETIH